VLAKLYRVSWVRSGDGVDVKGPQGVAAVKITGAASRRLSGLQNVGR
jgi:hypothetical protein